MNNDFGILSFIVVVMLELRFLSTHWTIYKSTQTQLIEDALADVQFCCNFS